MNTYESNNQKDPQGADGTRRRPQHRHHVGSRRDRLRRDLPGTRRAWSHHNGWPQHTSYRELHNGADEHRLVRSNLGNGDRGWRHAGNRDRWTVLLR